MNSVDINRLQGDLAAIAEPADRVLRQRKKRELRARVLPRAVKLGALIPVCYLLVRAISASSGIDLGLPVTGIAIVGLVVALVYYLGKTAGSAAVPRSQSLALIDDEKKLDDRLSAAHEFMAVQDPSPFMQAAIRDAETHIEQAQGFEAQLEAGWVPLGKSTPAWIAIAVLALFVTTWVDWYQSEPVGAGAKTVAELSGVTERDAEDVNGSDRRETPAPRPGRKPEGDRDPSTDPSERGDSGVTSKNEKKSRGEQGKGKTSKAQSSSGKSSGEGESTDQAQPTKGGKKPKPKKAKDKPLAERKKKPKPKNPQNDKDSVASSGQGKGKGSSKSPTASQWSSKDQSIADDDEELEDEDDVDDEDEESEARGGLQPNLRQRKPPVNRDLTLGFGGGKPPPHANGRGGPGLPKKQRGVAQLVLGIPYPDQITAQANPGRTKVTQERIEPQAQNAEPVAAETRSKRSTPMGHLSRTILRPWMQDLIRDFQISFQQQTVQEPSRGDTVRKPSR